MILTIAIIAGIGYLLNVVTSLSNLKIERGQGIHAANCILASWYLNPTVGIVFLCVAFVLTLITLAVYRNRW